MCKHEKAFTTFWALSFPETVLRDDKCLLQDTEKKSEYCFATLCSYLTRRFFSKNVVILR